MYLCYFVIISPWKWAWPFVWTNLNPLHPRMLCAKFGWNWLSDSGEEDFLISSMYFHYFRIISPWKRAGPFIWTNVNPLHPGIFCAKFGWNWPSGSGEEDEIVKSLQTDRLTDRRTDKRTDGQTDSNSYILPWTSFTGGIMNWLLTLRRRMYVSFGHLVKIIWLSHAQVMSTCDYTRRRERLLSNTDIYKTPQVSVFIER